VLDVLDPARSAKSRRSLGGTAPSNVRREAKRWIKRLEKDGVSR
jgi:argininosuccinate lyase